MSDSENTDDEESQEIVFMCRKCPGKTFASTEKDKHRAWHRKQKQLIKNKPGPKSRIKRGRGRVVSPSPSHATSLFSVVIETDPKTAANRKREAEKAYRTEKAKQKLDELIDGG